MDNQLLSNRDLQWQAQLLANYSGHIFVSRGLDDNAEHLTQTIVESSLAILALRAEVVDLKFQNSTLTSENKRLEAEMEQMEDEHRQERRKLIQSSKNHSSNTYRPASESAPITNAVAGPSRYPPRDSNPPKDLLNLFSYRRKFLVCRIPRALSHTRPGQLFKQLDRRFHACRTDATPVDDGIRCSAAVL